LTVLDLKTVSKDFTKFAFGLLGSKLQSLKQFSEKGFHPSKIFKNHHYFLSLEQNFNCLTPQSGDK
jgi:hypothetical protein